MMKEPFILSQQILTKEITAMRKMNLIASVCCLILMLVTVNAGFAAQKSAGNSADQTVASESLIVGKIDINNANEEMLTNLPGIGPKTATRITDFRKANGPFKSVDDLLNIKGIGPKVLDKIKPFATVS
jgi:competence protein ComEA